MAEACAQCGAEFGSAAELIDHTRKSHPLGAPSRAAPATPTAQRGYRCGLCGTSFPTPQQLAAHNLRPHAAERPAPRRPVSAARA
jgi:DNA-directed RNA polymerase subunit RPC12/RpoP